MIGIIFAIGCKSPFLGFGFRWSSRKPTYTLSLFTQSTLHHLKQLFDFMRERGVNHYGQLSEKLVLDYVEYLQSRNWSIATQRKYLISLRAFLRWVERDPSCRGLESFVRFLPRIPKAVRSLIQERVKAGDNFSVPILIIEANPRFALTRDSVPKLQRGQMTKVYNSLVP